MTGPHVLVLHGSPGSGKSTLLRPAAHLLAERGMARGLIDADELSLLSPAPEPDVWLANLAAIWPNYARVPDVHVVIAAVVADADRLARLRAAVPAASFAVCELTAPVDVLRARITAREPTEELRAGLVAWVDDHHARTDLEAVRDALVSTHDRSEEDAAREVLRAVGWID
jgi:predicted kinase